MISVLGFPADRSAPVELAELIGHSEVVSAVAFSPDGRTLAIHGYCTGFDGIITLWSSDTLDSLRATPAKYACAATGRSLSTAERARYIPELPYQRTCPN